MVAIMRNPTDATCKACRYHLPSILNNTDNRCSWAHANGIAATGHAYPTTEWMRCAAGACGPDGELWAQLPPPTKPPAMRPLAIWQHDDLMMPVAA